MLGTVAGHSDLNPSPVAATNPGAAAIKQDPAAALRSPVADSVDTDADVPFLLDLGLDPLLSEGLSRSKSRPVSNLSATAAGQLPPPPWHAQIRLWGSVAMAVTVTVLVVFLATRGPFRDLAGETKTGASSNPDAAIRPAPSGNTQSTIDRPAEPAIVVRFEDGEEIAANSLVDAMNRAMGTLGWVELRKNGPWHLAGDQMLAFGSGRGRLNIRAASGAMPVIEVAMGASQPFLETGSAVGLELSGLTFVVRYPNPGAPASPAPATLDRGRRQDNQDRPLRLRVVGNPGLKDSRAIFCNGGELEVDCCWFEGFDTAIDIDAVDRMPARIQQTMIVGAPAQPQPAKPRGWGVKFRATWVEGRPRSLSTVT